MDSILSFKNDLEELKNQRNMLQLKSEDAKTKAKELQESLKSMGFNSIQEATKAYQQQLKDIDEKRKQVQEMISEIKQVDTELPTKEEIMLKLQEPIEEEEPVQVETNTVSLTQPAEPVVQQYVPMQEQVESTPNVVSQVQASVQSQVPVQQSQPVQQETEKTDLGDMFDLGLDLGTPTQNVTSTESSGIEDLGNMLFNNL